MQKPAKNMAYKFLVRRDGEQCLICRRKPTKKRPLLDIDHADNNPENDDPENLHLLCHSCNCKMRSLTVSEHLRTIFDHSAKNERERERARGNGSTEAVKEMIDYQAGSPEMQANACFEIRFREWILEEIQKDGSYPKAEAKATGAELVGCSPLTIGRYISKLVSNAGPLEIAKNRMDIQVLRLKDYYKGD